MKEKLPLKELTEVVLIELSKMNYSLNTIKHYQRVFNRFIKYADENEEIYFSERLGISYIEECCGVQIESLLSSTPKKYNYITRSIRVLGDFQQHGLILRRMKTNGQYVIPKQFEHILNAYYEHCEKSNYSKRGMRTRISRLHFFIDYLDKQNILSVQDISASTITDYIKTICHNHEKSMASILTTLRVFLRFLYLNEYTKTDQSLNVPKYTRYYYPKVPSVWKKDDVIKLLKSIDRGNPTGKRDYAILLMITKLGIRVGDLKTLKLSSLDWNSRTIKFNQSKTKNEVSYPILDDIGWALIDYLKNGRPKSSNSQCIFIRLNAPFDEFGKDANLHYIISKHTREAGIKIPKGNRCGMHSLRHTLASILLEDGIPLPVITDILGHSSSKSTSTYIRTSIENLKNCVLDPDEKPTNE